MERDALAMQYAEKWHGKPKETLANVFEYLMEQTDAVEEKRQAANDMLIRIHDIIHEYLNEEGC